MSQTSVSISLFTRPNAAFADILDRAEALRAKRRAALALLDKFLDAIYFF